MRIDKYLKVSRIIKRRTLAKEVCDAGRVEVNGRVVKAGHEIQVGDRVSVRLPQRTWDIVVERVAENVPAKEAFTLYREV
ncbi:MAG: RNA-binding S4 domain-containing protein [Thermaerobacter sp.]|nr:RNA-binding S4 domain-containing protein [Thermaerobacter sp.]